MYFQFPDNAPCFLQRIFLNKIIGKSALWILRLFIARMIFFRIRIHDVHKIFDSLCPVKGCMMIMNTGMMLVSEWLDKCKDVTSAIPHIFGIHFLDIT